MDKQSVLAWHFCRSDKRLGNDDNRLIVPGETLSVEGPLKLCEHGLHGSKDILDALSYSKSSLVCRVRIWGDVLEDTDKLAGTHRKCLWMLDIDKILHEFACQVAEQALKAANVIDKRCWAAIEAKRAWLKGEISDKQLKAAWDAAWDAAGAAARVAWDAAWAAAWAAARDARAAAWAAARDARDARAAARAEQNKLLTKMVWESKAERKVTDG